MAQGLLLEEKCPRCGDNLVIRTARNGHDFIGCFSYPGCFFTREIKEGEELKLFVPPPTYCGKCNHTGLIPLIKADGTTSRYAQVFCECYEKTQHEYDFTPKPSDIDFPVSYSVYRSLCQQHSWQDPGPDRPTELEPPNGYQLSAISEPGWSRQQWQYVQQLRAQMLYQQKLLLAHITPKKKKRQGVDLA